MVRKYPKEVHEFVKNNCTKMRDDKLAEECNRACGTSFTKSSISAFRANHGYKNGMGRITSEEYWERQTRWPQGMKKFIEDNAEGTSNADMARMVNERFGTSFDAKQIKGFKARYHITSGMTGWFMKGHEPGNKGKKQEEYMSAEAIERTKATRFKKGHKVNDEDSIGTVKTDAYGYKIIKVQMQGTI